MMADEMAALMAAEMAASMGVKLAALMANQAGQEPFRMEIRGVGNK